MGNPCVCRKILVVLGTKHYAQLELNDQIWPRIKNKDTTWIQMIQSLEWMEHKGLVSKDKRKVEGNRVTLFYHLTQLGSEKLKKIRQEQEGGGTNDGAIFGENCCCKKAA